MRVSTLGSYLSGNSLMGSMRSAIEHTQRQIATGQTLLTPSDDPVASARALRMRESLARLEQFDRNAVIAENRLGHEESALSSVNNVLQRVRELSLQAANATQTNETRSMIAVEIREHLEQLVQLANQVNGEGEHIFSGNQTGTAPVVKVNGGYSYDGDQGQRLIAIGENRTVADGDSGDAVFFRIRAGNDDFLVAPGNGNLGSGVIGASSTVDPSAWVPGSYTVQFLDEASFEVRDALGALVTSGAHTDGDRIEFSGISFELDGNVAAGDTFEIVESPYRDIFSGIDALAEAIETSVTDQQSAARQANGINAGILHIDQAIGNVLEFRTQVGSRLSAIENQSDSNSAQDLILQESLADIEDLDYAEALSRLSQQISMLEAAQQSFVATQQLSLFDYI